MTRDEALAELEKPAMTEEQVRQEFEYISNKLGITSDELQSYFDAPNKTFRDYKSQQGIYDMGAKVLKGLGIEKGGKR